MMEYGEPSGQWFVLCDRMLQDNNRCSSKSTIHGESPFGFSAMMEEDTHRARKCSSTEQMVFRNARFRGLSIGADSGVLDRSIERMRDKILMAKLGGRHLSS